MGAHAHPVDGVLTPLGPLALEGGAREREDWVTILVLQSINRNMALILGAQGEERHTTWCRSPAHAVATPRHPHPHPHTLHTHAHVPPKRTQLFT